MLIVFYVCSHLCVLWYKWELVFSYNREYVSILLQAVLPNSLYFFHNGLFRLHHRWPIKIRTKSDAEAATNQHRTLSSHSRPHTKPYRDSHKLTAITENMSVCVCVVTKRNNKNWSDFHYLKHHFWNYHQCVSLCLFRGWRFHDYSQLGIFLLSPPHFRYAKGDIMWFAAWLRTMIINRNFN